MSLKRLAVLSFILFLLSFPAGSAFAVEIEVQGEGSALITPDVTQVQLTAQRDALKSALTVALDKVLGKDASKNPKVQAEFEHIMSQLDTYKMRQNDRARREGDNYIVNTVLTIDDGKFRKLLSDSGIALGTVTVRASSILTVMDEFFSLPTDFLTPPEPLKETTVYKYDRDADYKEHETLSAKGAAAKSVSAKSQEDSSASASGQAAGSYSGNGRMNASSPDGSASASGVENAKYAQQGSADSHHSGSASLDASSTKKSSVNYGQFVNASDREHEF